MSSTKTPILPGNFYHIYNHANGDRNLFTCDDNYLYFLKRFKKYMTPYYELYAYCLMPNHYHMLVRVKDFQTEVGGKLIKDENEYIKKTTNALKNWLVSYSNSYNKVYNLRGNLFIQRTRRRLIKDDEDFRNMIVYIHMNPVHHNFVFNIDDWKFTSYHEYFTDKNNLVDKSYSLDSFGDLENFKFVHNDKNLILLSEMYDLDF
mgnify:CR=1 FL=1